MRKLSKRVRVFTVAIVTCVVALGFALAACGSSNKGYATLDYYDAVMYVGDTKVLTAEAEDKNGNPFTGTYEWSTSNENVVKISNHIQEKCEIEAVATGSAVVTVKAGNFSASCDVYVIEKEPDVESVSLDKSALELTEGGEGTLTATATMSDGTAYEGTDFEWKIESGESFVSITPSGATCTITALSSGTAEISVTVNKASAICKVTVTAVHVHTYPSPDDGDFESLVTWDWDERDEEDKTVKVTVECRDCGESEVFTAVYTESADGDTLSATVNVGSYDYSSTYDVETGSSEQSGHTHSYTAAWEWNEADYTCKVTLTCSNEDDNCSEPTVTLDATVTPITVDSTCTVAGSVTYTASVEYGGTTYTTEGTDVKIVELPLVAHTLTAIEKIDATCTEDGTEAYWKCSVCEKLFSDGEGETEIEAATVIPATGHTYPDTTETSNIQWNWESKVGNETSGTVSVTLICTKCGKEIGAFAATYSVKSDDDTLWCAEYTVDNKTYTSTYPVSGESSGETSEAVAELDFTGSDFAEATLLAEGGATGDVALKYADGAETGFTVKGSKSDYKSVTISSIELGEDSGEYRQALVFNGSATNEKNSLAYTLDAGTYKIVLSYFNTNTGRYATVLDASGNEYVSWVAEEDKTDGSYEVFTREIYITLTASSTIYIGSKSNGLYMTYIGIFESDGDTRTVTGLSLDETTVTIEEDESIVLSAVVTLSDGKTYFGYTEATYEWTFSGSGSVTYTGSGNNITVTGGQMGDVEVMVSVDGTLYATCSVTVVEAYVPTLGEEKTSVKVDFSDASSYSWIESVTSGVPYTNGIMSFYTATDSSMKIESDELYTGGSSQSSKGRYFAIDLSSYVGDYVTIEVVFRTSNGDGRTMMIATSLVNTASDSSVLKYVAADEKNVKYTLAYAKTITNENSKLYITCSNGVYISSVSVVVNEIAGSKGSEPGGSEAGEYNGTISFSPESLTVEVGSEASFTFTVTVTLDGDNYTGSDIDIAVQSDDTSVATESWNSDLNTVTVNGVSAGTTYISIIVKVGDIEVINAKYTVVVTDASSPEEPSEPGEKTTVSGVSVDFSNSETYSWIATEQTSYTDSSNKTTEYNNAVKGISTTDDGILSVAGTSDNSASTPMDIGDKSSSAMTTGGKTQSGGRYFKIDLTSYEGMYVSVTIVTSGTGTESQSSKYLILGTNVSSTSVDEYTLANVTTSTSDVRQTLEYTDLITSTNSTLYVTWSDSVRIYTIDIEIYEYVSSSEPSEHSHNYEVSSWNWSDGYNECSVTLVCTVDGCTEKEITVTATVTSESTKTATCSEDGEITYTATASANDQTFTESKNVSTGKDSSNHVYPGQYDTENVVWHWDEITENSDEVSVTIYCAACGNEIATLTTTYTVYEGNSSYWYAEVSGDKYTYASTCKIPGEEYVYSEESFLIPIAQNQEEALSDTFGIGDLITDNVLFSITADVDMGYGYGKTDTFGTVQASGKEFSYTDMNNNEIFPNQGIRMGGNGIDEAVENADGGYTYSSEDDIISFTAKENIHLYIYFSFANDSYNSDRSGLIYYRIDDGDTITAASPTKRNEAFTISVELNSGETLVIGAENHSIRSATSTSAATAKFWLWGAEAYTLEGEKPDYTVEKTVTFVTNQASISVFTRSVFNYSAVSAPVLPNVSGCYFVGWYSDSGFKVAYDFSEPVTEDMTLYARWVQFESGITYIQGAYESIAIEFYESNLDGLRIYYKGEGDASYTLFTDTGAIRTIDDGTYLVRVDISGLSGDKYYSVKILTSANEELTDDGTAYSIYVASYDRSGYAHFNYDDGVGAYEDDGTLKDGALVIYVTEGNKNNVTDDVYKYDKVTDTYTKVTWGELSTYLKLTYEGDLELYDRFGDGYVRGIGEILNNSRYSEYGTGRTTVGIAALCNAYGAVDIRIVGEVKAELVDGEVFWGYDDEDNADRWMVKGTYDIIGLTDLNAETNGGTHGDNGGLVRMRDAHDLTIEGVGEGAVVNGWGFSFIAASANTGDSVRTGKGFEVRNLTFVNYTEDAIGMEGVQADSGSRSSYLTSSVERCWIHNNTFYAGYCEYPAESDKGEGDGTCDFKRGQYLTISYNYFEGCHKTDLFGANDNNLQFNISMHHNFWYNCKSRMPLVRSANVHFYNNYILGDNGNIDTVMSVRADAYVFAEYNYFDGCKNLFTITDTSSGKGTIKSYNNVVNNCTYPSSYSDGSVTVTSRTQKVSNNCKYEYYGIDYSSFDTDPELFYYDSAKGRSDCYITSAEQAKIEVMQTAGAFSRDKVVSENQLISAEDVSKPTSPYFDLSGEAPDGTSLTYSEIVLASCRKDTF